MTITKERKQEIIRDHMKNDGDTESGVKAHLIRAAGEAEEQDGRFAAEVGLGHRAALEIRHRERAAHLSGMAEPRALLQDDRPGSGGDHGDEGGGGDECEGARCHAVTCDGASMLPIWGSCRLA